MTIDQAIQLLQRYPFGGWLIAVVLMVLGGLLFRRGRVSSRVSLIAKSRGVVIGGSNSGNVLTGDQSSPPSKASSDLIAAVGVLVSILGVVVAVVAWLYPKAPG